MRRTAGPPEPEQDAAQAQAQAQADAMLASDTATTSLGMQVREVAPGRATVTMTVTEAMVNGHGICHGGYVFLLADTAFAFACNTHGPAVVAAGAVGGNRGRPQQLHGRDRR